MTEGSTFRSGPFNERVKKSIADGHEYKNPDASVVLLSSGLDSMASLAIACEENEVVHPIFFRYGNATDDVEQTLSERLVDWVQFNQNDAEVKDLQVIDLEGAMQSFIRSDQTLGGEEVDEEDRNVGYIPHRNAIFLSFGASYASNHGCQRVYIGTSMGDLQQEEPLGSEYAHRWDVFLEEMERPLQRGCLKGNIQIWAPLLRENMDYAETAKYLEMKGWPLEYSYSCFKETDPENPSPCGECSTCKDRIEAMEEAGVTDPLYE